MESIKNRRTIRKYKQDDVPAALLINYWKKRFALPQWEICSYIVW